MSFFAYLCAERWVNITHDHHVPHTFVTCSASGAALCYLAELLRSVVGPFFLPQATMSNHPLIGKPAPVLSLPNADGTTYELKPGADGKPTAVFFYPKAGVFLLFAS